MELLVLGLVATVGFTSYALWARARHTEASAQPPELEAPDRTPTTLQIGDVVQHLGTDWIVEGVLSLADDKGARLYRLADGGAERYLFATTSDPDPSWLDRVELGEASGAEIVEHGGQSFRLRGRASSTALRAGVLGAVRPAPAGDRITLAEYGAGASRLVILQWSDHADAFAGERVPAHLLELLPGK